MIFLCCFLPLSPSGAAGLQPQWGSAYHSDRLRHQVQPDPLPGPERSPGHRGALGPAAGQRRSARLGATRPRVCVSCLLHSSSSHCLFSSSSDFDGLFISNGPGDPEQCEATISNVRKVVCVERPKPVFGICLGHQLLSLVIGSKTYKMK